MAQIKVTRKSYVRKDGTMVKGITYYTRDKGKQGKTPESEKFYRPKVEMHWHKDQPAKMRRTNALKAHEGDELATARALQALANVTTDIQTAKLAKIDADYFFARHQ
jgi:phage/plasmid-associated DNA primase